MAGAEGTKQGIVEEKVGAGAEHAHRTSELFFVFFLTED